MARYELGNDLRGWFSGDYASDDEAWSALSARYDAAYPSRSGRQVMLRKYVRSGTTTGGNETERDREIRESLERAREWLERSEQDQTR